MTVSRQERLTDIYPALLMALDALQSRMWTALPGIVQSFDTAKKTVVVQCAVQARYKNPAGIVQWLDLPPLLDVPVVFPSGGGFTLTFPVSVGDECLIVFSSRCIDAWWQSGGTKNKQALLRMHDLSDGFAFVGCSSVPNVPPSISTNSTQLRSHDGATNIDVKSGIVTVNAASTVVNSTTSAVNASVSATITSPSIILKNAGIALKNLLNAAFSTWAANHTHTDSLGGATSIPTSAPGADTQTSTVQAE